MDKKTCKLIIKGVIEGMEKGYNTSLNPSRIRNIGLYIEECTGYQGGLKGIVQEGTILNLSLKNTKGKLSFTLYKLQNNEKVYREIILNKKNLTKINNIIPKNIIAYRLLR